MWTPLGFCFPVGFWVRYSCQLHPCSVFWDTCEVAGCIREELVNPLHFKGISRSFNLLQKLLPVAYCYHISRPSLLNKVTIKMLFHRMKRPGLYWMKQIPYILSYPEKQILSFFWVEWDEGRGFFTVWKVRFWAM